VQKGRKAPASRFLIRAAGPADLPAIMRIQAGAPEAANWSASDYLSHNCWVAENDDGIIGFLVVRHTAADEHEILNLAVSLPYRKRGVGRALVEDGTVAPGTWFLEVRESNRPAIALYRSLGFEPVGRRTAYYLNPPEAGIVMKRGS
jgi:ribosomal-protein-alanine N-acetyltransferase